VTLPVVQRAVVAWLVGGTLTLSACSAVGPQMVARDRFDYNGEVARSWKEQTLLNIVRARYLDMPVFLEVAQIVSGYTLESTVALGATDARSGARVAPGDNLTFGTQGRWTDRPTITYTPLTGAQFNRNMLTPIPPASVLFTMQAGWPIDLVFRVVVKSINGINSEGDSAERYERVVFVMRTLQKAEVLGMRLQGEAIDRQAVVLFFRARALTPEHEALLGELREALSLLPGQHEFRVLFGAGARQDGEIAMLTRSMLQILIDLGAYVTVPDQDVQQGRTRADRPQPEGGGDSGILRIRSGGQRPTDALVLVPYRGGWFWIDDRDIASKRTFALVMVFSTLSETGGREGLPLVTIPAG
jgi:hypothetical protein